VTNEYESPDALDMPISHTEAPWVAFTNDVQIGGRRWNFTIRQGMGQDEIDIMIGLVHSLNSAFDDIGASEPVRDTGSFEPARNSGPPAPVQGKPTEMPSRASGADDHDLEKVYVFRSRSIEVAGKLEDARVLIFDKNPRLKFPVVQPKSFILADILNRRYADVPGMDKLIQQISTPGFAREGVEWEIYYKPSPKNPEKWKDLVDVIIPSLEGAAPEGDQ
jgi:hypothetical protein